MKKILIVEDDRLIAELERDYLEVAGFETAICADGAEGLRLALGGGYDLLLLDVMLPGASGFDICREVRKEQDVPILLVTAKQEDVDKIRGLGLGADDYVTKPFSPAELTARVKAHIQIHERLLRRPGANGSKPSDSIETGALVIHIPSHRVMLRGKEVVLKNREFDLLLFLASHPNVVFSKDTLYDRLWGADSLGDTATVTVHINRLREKLERDPSAPEYIHTVWGAGYRFCYEKNNGGLEIV